MNVFLATVNLFTLFETLVGVEEWQAVVHELIVRLGRHHPLGQSLADAVEVTSQTGQRRE
jgi:hypothetical protein